MTKEELLDGTDLFLFDLDGTVYLGDVPVPGAPEALARLRADGKRVVFLTNNSSKTHAEYEKSCAGWGYLRRATPCIHRRTRRRSI